MPVFLKLEPGTKKPTQQGWTSPSFTGLPSDQCGEWVGMRTDGLVVVDCDTLESYAAWLGHIGQPPEHTLTVKTPRPEGGYHCYYRRVVGAPSAPYRGVLPELGKLDIRAGLKSQVAVPPTPGYTFAHESELAQWDLNWISESELSSSRRIVPEGETWDTIPDGNRNATLFAMASGWRRQGMSEEAILEDLRYTNERRCDPPLPDRELRIIAGSAAKYEPTPDLPIELDEEKPKLEIMWGKKLELPPPPEWLWRPYLPKGRLIMVDGEEGIGKGMFCVHLAVERMQLGENVLWLTAEDDPEEDVLRRLFAAGWTKDTGGDVGFLPTALRVPAHTEHLRKMIESARPSMVFLDPGRSFLSAPDGTRDFNYNNDAHVRPGLQEMARLARHTNATFVFVHHWNKSQGEVRLKSSGTVAFRQVPRLQIAMQRINGEGALAVAKANIGTTGHVRRFWLESVPEYQSARIVIGDELPFCTLDEWATATKEKQDSVLVDRDDEVLPLPPGTNLDRLQLNESVALDLMHRGLIHEIAGSYYRTGRDAD